MQGEGKRLTIPEMQDIRRRYEAGESTEKIARDLGRSGVGIRKAIIRIGGKIKSMSEAHRQYTINESAFDDLSPDTRYWVGFLLADGYILDNGGKSNPRVVGIHLQEGDRDQLEKFKRFVGASNPIREKTQELKDGSIGKYVKFSVTSEKIAARLTELGVTPRKSHTAEAIEELSNDVDFWRGVVDGDGQVTLDGTHIAFSITGTHRVCEQFNAFITRRIPCEPRIYKIGNVYQTRLSARSAAACVFLLYNNASTALQRKLDTVAKIAEMCENRKFYMPRGDVPENTKICSVKLTSRVSQMANAGDLPFNGISSFTMCEKPVVPEDFSLGIIVGGSGTGKSTLLEQFGTEEQPRWDDEYAIVDGFDSAEEASDKLMAAGLNSLKDWLKPFYVLSTGQKFRANLARKIKNNAVIDEYSSVVDRDVAMSASIALSRYIRNNNVRGVVISTCHRDVIDWLQPDWVYDTDERRLLPPQGPRKPIHLSITEIDRGYWKYFKDHHYLSGSLLYNARCFGAWIGEPPRYRLVGFHASSPMPGQVPDAHRGHRTVVLPEFQGMGIGSRFVELVGDILLGEGKRFFCRTAHPLIWKHRNKSAKWRPTQTHEKARRIGQRRKSERLWDLDTRRVCASHEYLGNLPEAKLPT